MMETPLQRKIRFLKKRTKKPVTGPEIAELLEMIQDEIKGLGVGIVSARQSASASLYVANKVY